jgi:anti-sigma-K factor RskA
MVVSRHSDEHLDLCAEYALGTIDDLSRRRLEEHLRDGCRECEAALRDFGAATTALAATATAAKPSAALRDRVAAAARREPRRAPARSSGGLRVATFVLAAASVVFSRHQRSLVDARAEADGPADGDARAAGQRATTARPGAVVGGVPHRRGYGLLQLQSHPARVDSTVVARACFSPANGEAVVMLDHATAPAGKDYELWVLRGDTPTSLGLVRADAGGHAVVHLPALANAPAITAFAVSVEATGGSTGAGPQGPVGQCGSVEELAHECKEPGDIVTGLFFSLRALAALVREQLTQRRQPFRPEFLPCVGVGLGWQLRVLHTDDGLFALRLEVQLHVGSVGHGDAH